MDKAETKKGLDTFDNVVVLMLENRSFDNLLGYLYDPKYNKDGKGVLPKGKSFEGLQGKEHSNPVPPHAPGAEEHLEIAAHPVPDACEGSRTPPVKTRADGEPRPRPSGNPQAGSRHSEAPLSIGGTGPSVADRRR